MHRYAHTCSVVPQHHVGMHAVAGFLVRVEKHAAVGGLSAIQSISGQIGGVNQGVRQLVEYVEREPGRNVRPTRTWEPIVAWTWWHTFS